MKTPIKHLPAVVALAAATPFVFSQASAATTAVGDGVRSTGEGIASAGQGLLNLPSRISNIRNPELPMIATGVQELGLDGNFDWSNETIYNARLKYGWFVTDCWLFGIQTTVGGVNSDVSVTAGLFAEYNFLTGTKWVPFVGGSASYKRVDTGDSDDGLETTLEFGVKYFLRSNMALSVSGSGGWFTAGDDGDDGISSRVNFGLRYYF